MSFIKPIFILLLAAFTFLQCTKTENPPSENLAVIPAKHEGWGMEQFEKINDVVKQNQGEIDLLFIGDSITQRWAEAGKPVWDKFYSHRKAVNIGISGERTEHILWRLENGNIDGIYPKVSIVLIGTNNVGVGRFTAEQTVDGVRAVVSSLVEKRPDTKIILMGIFPRGHSFNEQRVIITQINQALAKLHDGETVYFMDIGHTFVDEDGFISEELMPTGVHPSEKGFRIWAEALEPLIVELLGEN